MKNNTLPTYENGTVQHVYLRKFGNLGLTVPYSNFLDEYSQREWSKYVAKRAQKTPFERSEINSLIRNVVMERRSPQTRRRIQLRVRGQNNAPDVLASRKPFIERVAELPLTPDKYKYDRAVGIEIESLRPSGRTVELPVWAREGYDGSLRAPSGYNAIEYKLLVKRSELEMRLHKFCGLIADHKVNTTCGLHVHLDCRGKTEADVKKIAQRMSAWMSALQEFVPESRRSAPDGRTNYCQLPFSSTDRYRAVNFTAFRKYKTLEIRFHSGTVDYTKIIAWIRLCELLFVLPTKPRAGASGVAALSQLPLSEYERSYWLKRHQTLNPRQYPSANPTTESE
jgi:hypothetical protein